MYEEGGGMEYPCCCRDNWGGSPSVSVVGLEVVLARQFFDVLSIVCDLLMIFLVGGFWWEFVVDDFCKRCSMGAVF